MAGVKTQIGNLPDERLRTCWTDRPATERSRSLFRSCSFIAAVSALTPAPQARSRRPAALLGEGGTLGSFLLLGPRRPPRFTCPSGAFRLQPPGCPHSHRNVI